MDGIGPAARFDVSEGLAFSGDLYVTDSFGGVLRRIDLATREVTTVFGKPGEYGFRQGPLSAARLNGPWGIAPAPNGAFMTDVNENVVLWLHAQ